MASSKKATVINCSYLNKRSGAGTSYKVVSTVKKGYSGTVTTSKKVGSSTWYKWSDGTWSNGKYLKLVSTSTSNNKNSSKSSSGKSTKKKTMFNTNKKSTKSSSSKTNKADKGSNFAKYKKNNNGSEAVANKSDFTMLTSTSNNVKSGLIFKAGYSSKVEGKDDFTLKYNFINSQINSIKKSFNLTPKTEIEGNDSTLHKVFHMNFNRFKLPYPDEALQKSFGYVFFTRPDCNLLKENGNLREDVKKLPEYYYMFKTGRRAFKSLTNNYYEANHSFHPLLSNLATSFELSDENIETIEHGEAYTGHKIIYGGTDIKSKTGGTFTVGFTDNKRLDVYKILKTWEMYISDVKRGVLSPTRVNIKKKILDYAASAYYILVGPNGEDILFWSKYYGVFPTTSPSSEFSFRKGDLMATPNYSIPFAYSFKKDFSVFSLAEFNMLGNEEFKYREVYDSDILSVGLTWTGAPFIETVLHEDGGVSYKLRFRVS